MSEVTFNNTKTMEGFSEDGVFDVSDADIEKKKKLSTKNDPEVNKIMENYTTGYAYCSPSETYLKKIYGLGKKEKIKTSILYGKIPTGVDEEEYKEAVQNYLRGSELMNQAKADMIEKLSLFIYYVISKKFSTFREYTAELYQEAVIGIMKGIDSYDPTKSAPTTYFAVYIQHEMTEFINLTVNKTTSHYSSNIVKVKKAIDHFERNGREWAVTDIAQETGISPETITQALNIMEHSNEIHFDTPDFLDMNLSRCNLSPEEEYVKKEDSELLMKAVNRLDRDKRNIIILKYGLSGEEPLSYKNISDRLDIQIDKVKKLMNQGIKELRRSHMIKSHFKNLKREEKALNESIIGIVPVETGETLMDELDKAFGEDE